LPNRTHPAASREVPTPLEIKTLTRKMVEGDETAYRQFFQAYFARLSRYLLVVAGGNEEIMREGLQETLRRVARHIRVFPDEATLWSWLTVLARSARVDESRRRGRYRSFLDRFSTSGISDQPQDPGPHNDRLAESLEAKLANLLPEERTLIERKYFEGQSVREIACHLHTTEKAIESRLARVRQKLKAEILTDLQHD
jgi:RNA polymerase sigma factor (sigma-70 family)